VLLLARLRHELSITQRGRPTVELLVEESVPVAVVAGASEPLTDQEASALLYARAAGTLKDAVRQAQLAWMEQQRHPLQQLLGQVARTRADQLLADHRRVRDAADARGSYAVRALEPVDVIGAWVLLPEAN
jgi:hypothetical protein